MFPQDNFYHLDPQLPIFQLFNSRCPQSNVTAFGQLLASSSQSPLPQALASTDMGYVDGLLRAGDEVDSTPIDFIAHVYVMPILLLFGKFFVVGLESF
jgi:hypothetical protein